MQPLRPLGIRASSCLIKPLTAKTGAAKKPHVPTLKFRGDDVGDPENAHINGRKIFWGGSLGIGLATAGGVALAGLTGPLVLAAFVPWAAYTGLGVHDLLQRESAIERNHPVWGRLRKKAEGMRKPVRQYIIENDTDEVPYSREQRALIYSRSKGQTDKKAFGTLHNLQADGAEWLQHSMAAVKVTEEPRVTIGGPDCAQPYRASVFNTSAMSYGALGDHAVMAMNKGAYLDNFFQNTGEGGLSPFHLGIKVDIEDPNFDMKQVLALARKPMTPEEIKQAVKDGQPGMFKRGFAKLIPSMRLPGHPKFTDDQKRSIEARPVPKAQLQALASELVQIQPKSNKLKTTAAATVSKPETETKPQKRKRWAGFLRSNTLQYYRFPSGDLCWQIGTGYFGCRNADGTFNEEKFKVRATLPQVKLIELKLSQGAKPGYGGNLPAHKNHPGIAKIRELKPYTEVESPEAHSAFSKPTEMMHFIKKLRDLSGGKPVGFKLCVGSKREFFAVCKAMMETGIYPDFITVDGAEGGTGSAPLVSMNNVGMPIDDALVFVNNTLRGIGVRDRIRIIASGKVVDEYDILSKIARGADLCSSARAMMLSTGCIQARVCNTDKCPVGVATHDKDLQRGLDPDDKGLRNASYHRETIKGLKHLMGAAGIGKTSEITPDIIEKRVKGPLTLSLRDYLEQEGQIPTVNDGDFLNGKVPFRYMKDWLAADPSTFRAKPATA